MEINFRSTEVRIPQLAGETLLKQLKRCELAEVSPEVGQKLVCKKEQLNLPLLKL